MKKIFVAIVLLLAAMAFAHDEMKTPEDVINSVMKAQNVSVIKEISCSKITSDEFEELGDAVMERMAGDHELHEQMDLMMGGEGSASLRSMHIAMGSNWVGCTRGSIMGTNMMPMMMRMMGNYYPGYYSGYDTSVLAAVAGWVLFGAAILYMHTSKKKRR